MTGIINKPEAVAHSLLEMNAAPQRDVMENLPNLELKRMNTCSFQTALEVWNEGFQGYFVDMTLSLERFLTRITSDDVSPEYSFIAFVENKPVGFLLNAIRNNPPGKFAWNGGTGVIPAFRGRGIGRSLVSAALDLYSAEGVNVAMLEAISKNEVATSLFKQCGYEIIDELTIMHTDRPVERFEVSSCYTHQRVTPAAVGTLSFYRELSAWQGQWQSLIRNHGEAFVILDPAGSPVAYVLYKNSFDDVGNLSSISLYQCEVAPNRDDVEAITAFALQLVFPRDAGGYRRRTHNFRKSNQSAVTMLMKAGFMTFMEQVHMIRTMT